MASNMRLSSLIPAGLMVERIADEEGVIVVSARAAADERACPLCGRSSSRVHSRYVRTVADLPCGGKMVELRLMARRFVCSAPFCRRRSSPNALMAMLSPRDPGGPRAWSVSFIILGWRSAGGRLPEPPGG